MHNLVENVGKETILKVTDWLRRIWEMRRHNGPVQQWVDSIPLPVKSDIAIASECQEYITNKPLTPTEPKSIPFSKKIKLPSMTISAPTNVPNSPVMATPIPPSSLPHYRLARDPSFQSDSSHCSSVESLLELRKADPAAILLDLGFGGCSATPQQNGPLSRIPKRFLQPSSLKGIAVNDFVKQEQQTSESLDTVSLGYRGLTGSPHVTPSEIVQKIMERLREHETHETDTNLILNSYEQHNPLHQNGKLSVLSPSNRQFLEQSRSKSPDMSNKRMIIGQKSFAFGCDGSLIEISSSNTNLASNDVVNNYNTMMDNNESVELKRSSSTESITFKQHYFLKNDKRLSQQLSFDDAIEFSDTNRLLKDNRKFSLNSLNIAQTNADVDSNKKEYDSSNITSKYGNDDKFLQHPDIRRASDSLYEIKSLEDKVFDEGRRFSDGAMQIIENQSNECTLLQKRKSFKRQSRIYDTNASHYCELNPIDDFDVPSTILKSNVDNEEEKANSVNNAHKSNIVKPSKSSKDKNNLELETNTKSLSRKFNYIPSKISEFIDKIEPFKDTQDDLTTSDSSCTEDNQISCYKKKACKKCKHGRNCSDCCCHVDKRKCCEKMEKIMQENKKLEDMLARSRREVAEIRDMLSSVLSVRMEPGF